MFKVMSTALQVMDQMDRLITRISPLALGVLGATSIYYVAFSYGAGVVVLAVGRDAATQLFGNAVSSPLIVLVGVPLVPVALIALEASDVEGKLLVLWRNSVSPALSGVPILGPLLEWLWPTPAREPLASTVDGLGSAMDFISRSVSAGLILPFLAYAFGVVFFRSVTNSNLKRMLMGGIMYYSLKTATKIYLKQQEYRRQGLRRVLNYQHVYVSSSSNEHLAQDAAVEENQAHHS